jgi:hypothetical protein
LLKKKKKKNRKIEKNEENPTENQNPGKPEKLMKNRKAKP